MDCTKLVHRQQGKRDGNCDETAFSDQIFFYQFKLWKKQKDLRFMTKGLKYYKINWFSIKNDFRKCLSVTALNLVNHIYLTVNSN